MRINFQKTKNTNLDTFLNTVLIKHEVFIKHTPLPIILQMASLQLHINTDLKLCSVYRLSDFSVYPPGQQTLHVNPRPQN